MILVIGVQSWVKGYKWEPTELGQLNFSCFLPFLHSFCFSLHPSISPSWPSIYLLSSPFLFPPFPSSSCYSTLWSFFALLSMQMNSWVFTGFFDRNTGFPIPGILFISYWSLSTFTKSFYLVLPFKSLSWFDESYLPKVVKTQCFDDMPGLSPNAQLSFGWDHTVGSATFLYCPNDIALLILIFLSHSWKDWYSFQCSVKRCLSFGNFDILVLWTL